MMAAAREKVNKAAGSCRMLAHAIFTPGTPGWLDDLTRAMALKPDSLKGYTIGDNTHKNLARHPWRMDDEKPPIAPTRVCVKYGIKNVCVTRVCSRPRSKSSSPPLRPFVDVKDVGKAAKDWPQLNFPVHHSGYPLHRRRRQINVEATDAGMAQMEKTGRVEWVSDLAEIPAKYGVNNVYGDLGQLFASTLVAQPRLPTFIVGPRCRKGLGPDRIVWGTDALWTAHRNGRSKACAAWKFLRHAEKIRIQSHRPGRRPDQDRDLQRQQFAPLQLPKRSRQWSKMDRFSALKGGLPEAQAPTAPTCATATSRFRQEAGRLRQVSFRGEAGSELKSRPRGTTAHHCHSEERSDEESAVFGSLLMRHSSN